ncbi:MAG: ABC transporter ATP-binding protein [Mesorhizobium sp.]|uniref:ABC transporter ATP-binding protein n=1 Tax=Mesorhizobium sp. TaxID=1871066 RepID=UPI000FE530B0|nr:ABC transporter ATP-binding protein [Mesorhizobium sp.]RWI48931.1 MAG: ABC transporter ATP-binding protein [Mesorhizobium sp.]
MAEAALDIDKVTAGYAGRMALDAISLSAKKSELTAIVGPNGHGKTTLIKAISGLIPVKTGEIRCDGERIDRLRPDQIVMRGVVHVPQGDLLFPAMTVHENLLMGAYLNRGDREVAKRLDFVFTLLPKLKERRSQTAGTLSGGERRMCGIGRGLMAGGEILMLDEPSLGLAPIVIEQIYDVIFNLRREGRTILLVEENAQRIAEEADVLHLLDNGRIAWSGPGTEFMARPEIVQAYLGI